MEYAITDSLGTRQVLITGATGVLGLALKHEFPEAIPLSRTDWDITLPPPPSLPKPDLVLHAAAWTDVDGAESNPQDASNVNVGGTEHVAGLAVPLVYYSTDYVFDGRKSEPYVESDSPNPLSAYGRSKAYGEAAAGDRAWIVRTSGLFGPTGHNFVQTMLKLGAERDVVDVVDDQRASPTYVAHLARATREVLEKPFGIWHIAGGGECTWAEFAEAIFEDARLDCRVRRVSTHELGRPAPRPAYCALRSEKGAPQLPAWRDGLREFLNDRAKKGSDPEGV